MIDRGSFGAFAFLHFHAYADGGARALRASTGQHCKRRGNCWPVERPLITDHTDRPVRALNASLISVKRFALQWAKCCVRARSPARPAVGKKARQHTWRPAASLNRQPPESATECFTIMLRPSSASPRGALFTIRCRTNRLPGRSRAQCAV